MTELPESSISQNLLDLPSENSKRRLPPVMLAMLSARLDLSGLVPDPLLDDFVMSVVAFGLSCTVAGRFLTGAPN